MRAALRRSPVTLGVSTVIRFGLAAAWLWAGFSKVGATNAMVRSVRAFRILPESLVHPVAYSVPVLEIALGVLLIAGLAIRTVAIISALLIAVYLAAIISAAARGLRIDCGCFSAGGDLQAGQDTHYTSEIVRDSALVLVASLLAVFPRSVLSVDRWILQPQEEKA